LILNPSKQNFVAIESLRGLMAWWVVIGHAIQLCGAALPEAYGPSIFQKLLEYIQHGATPVGVFIIVSGFVITHLLMGSETSYKNYIARRALRIFPIYIFCLVFSVFTIDFFVAAYIELPYSQYYQLRLDRFFEQSEHFVAHFVLHLTLLQGMVPENILKYSSATLLTPAWSLSLEWQFYLVAPILLALLKRNFLFATMTIIASLGLSIVTKIGIFGVWEFPAFLPLSINGFLIGILSRIAIALPSQYFKIGIYGVLSMTLALVGIKVGVIWILFYFILLSEIGYLRISFGAFGNFIKLLVLNSYLSRIGRWSYSTYLLHIPFFTVIVGGYVMIFGLINTSRETVIVLLCFSAPALLWLSWLSYSFIEKPFMKFGKNRGLVSHQN
jgi:peptidoglycan/LPS O-acetylase OafA/YrhL